MRDKQIVSIVACRWRAKNRVSNELKIDFIKSKRKTLNQGTYQY